MSKSTRYLFFDTETSGLPRQMDVPITRLDNWPRVVQLAWILTDFQGRVISEKQFLIQPGNWRMQPGALKVHGITLGHARRFGRPLTEVLSRFALDLVQTDSIIGHNVQFDQKILGAEFLRVGQTNPLQKRHAQCTMKMGARFLQRQAVGRGRSTGTLESPVAEERLEVASTVEAVAEDPLGYRVSRAPVVEGATWRDAGSGFRYPSLRRLHLSLFGEAFSNAHDALADTRACMNCFFQMCR